MATLLKAVGQLVSRVQGDTAVIDKLDVLTYIEEMTDTLHAVQDALADGRVTERLSDIVKNPKPPSANDKTVHDAHDTYFRALPTGVQVIERRGAFDSLRKAVSMGIEDLVAIKQSYPDLFGGMEKHDMQAGDVKMTSVVTLGYIESLMDMTSWTIYLLNVALTPDDASSGKVPPYQTVSLHTDAESVSHTVAEIFNRLNGETFLSAIDAMRRRGRDVYIESNGHTIDQYADDQDYNGVEMAQTARFMRSPMLILGTKWLNFKQTRYDQMKTMRSWLATKVGLLNLQQTKADRDSPEFHRLEKIIQNYSNQLSTYDKKISHYESS